MSRYSQLLTLIDSVKPAVIVEVGTWNGLRAIEMATAALQHQQRVEYVGFDLFEEASDETDERELNVKPHHSIESVTARLAEFADAHPGFSFKLVRGNTHTTMIPGVVPEQIDFAFIDGGHSVETIAHDYEAVKHAKVVVFDDYYVQENGCPDITKYGCNQIVEKMESLILPSSDPVKGGGVVRMAVVPPQAWNAPVRLVVKTNNCVPSEEITHNVSMNVPRIKRWVKECERHSKVAVIVAGGPTYREHIGNIREHYANGDYVFCVKSSHDYLIENNIIPYGCLLLDPRAHVLDYVSEPHKAVRYFVASMVHPSTLDKLLEADANVIGYNALVGAGENEVLAGFGDHILLSGGSTAATRGVSVLNALGFRDFHLYGFDSCYKRQPKKDETHGVKKKDPIKVEVANRKFWTDPELIAQAQDFEKIIAMGTEMKLHLYGDGLIQHIFNTKRRILPQFLDVMND